MKFTLGSLRAKYGSPPVYKAPRGWDKDNPLPFDADEFNQRVQDIASEQAGAFLELLLYNIRTNKFKFPLAPSTIEQKGSAIPWVDTKELYSHITSTDADVYVSKGVHKKAGITYQKLALILEYGQKERGIPPRDVFRRTFDEFKQIMVDNVLNDF